MVILVIAISKVTTVPPHWGIKWTGLHIYIIYNIYGYIYIYNIYIIHIYIHNSIYIYTVYIYISYMDSILQKNSTRGWFTPGFTSMPCSHEAPCRAPLAPPCWACGQAASAKVATPIAGWFISWTIPEKDSWIIHGVGVGQLHLEYDM